MKNLINEILQNHTKIIDKVRKVYETDEGIEVTVKQEKNKVVIWGFNSKTQRFINLGANKYKNLIDGFKGVSSDLYSKENRYYITLSNDIIRLIEKQKVQKVYGYCRISTRGQLEGNGLESQEQEILSKYQNAEIIKEQYTAAKLDRPILNKLVEDLQEGDTLVVTKLDRLARNTVEGIQIIEGLFDRGISVHVLNVGLLENTTMGKFFLTTLLSVAEMERNIIIERTQSGKEIAKQKDGFKDGRPKKFSNKQIEHALSLLESNSYKEVEQMTGISKSTMIRAKKARRN